MLHAFFVWLHILKGLLEQKDTKWDWIGDFGACKKISLEINLRIQEACDKKKVESQYVLEVNEDDDK